MTAIRSRQALNSIASPAGACLLASSIAFSSKNSYVVRYQGFLRCKGNNAVPAKRQKLTREMIIDKALALIEQDGLENLSTRALGKRLGVQAMALYHHV